MNEAYQIIKNDLKKIAKEITKLKAARKKVQYGYVKGLDNLRQEYRHKHIAKCELKGVKRSKIEIPAKNNQPNEYQIERYKKEFTKLIKKHQPIDTGLQS